MSLVPGKAALTKREWLALVVLTLIAAVVRLIGLGSQDLWFDELCTWRFATYPTLQDVILHGSIKDFHPPGYQAFMFYWIRAFGDSEFALRLPSAIGGILSVPALFLLGRKLLNVRAGSLAALMMALMIPAVDHSKEARSYTLMLLFAILTTSLWMDFYGKTFAGFRVPAWKLVSLLVLLVALAYSHYYGMFLAGLQVLCFLSISLYRRKGMLWAPGVLAFFALALLPWAGGLQQHLGMKQGWIPRIPPGQALLSYAGFLYTLMASVMLLFAALTIVAPIPFRLRFYDKADERHRNALFFLVAWLIVPFVIVVAKSQVSNPIYWPRYMFICMPAAYLLVGYALSRIRSNVWVPTLLSLGLIGATWWEQEQHGRLTQVRPTGWKEVAAKIVESMKSDGETGILVIPQRHGVADYYFQKLGGLTPDANATNMPELKAALFKLAAKKPRYLWVILADPGDSQVIIEDALSAASFTGAQVDEFKVDRVWAYKFIADDWDGLERELKKLK